MSGTKFDRRAARSNAAADQNEELIARAAKCAALAGTALESAAEDLSGTHGLDGSSLTSLAEVVRDEAVRVSHLAEDIDSQRHAESDAEASSGTDRTSPARATR